MHPTSTSTSVQPAVELAARVAALEALVIKQAHLIEKLQLWHNALRTRVDCHENNERMPHMVGTRRYVS
jgi:hypothetical protein